MVRRFDSAFCAVAAPRAASAAAKVALAFLSLAWSTFLAGVASIPGVEVDGRRFLR